MIIFKHPKILDCYGPGGAGEGGAGSPGGPGGPGGTGPSGGGIGGPGDPGADPTSSGDPTSAGYGGLGLGEGLSTTGDPALDANIDTALNDFFGDLDTLADPQSGFWAKTKAKFNINYRADFSDQINYAKLLGDVAKPLTLGGMLAGFAPAVTLGLVAKATSTVAEKFQSDPDAAILAGLPPSEAATTQSTTVSRAQPISKGLTSTSEQDSRATPGMTAEGFRKAHSPKSFNYQNTYSGSVDPKAPTPDLVGLESQDAAWEAQINKIKSYLKTPTYKELYS